MKKIYGVLLLLFPFICFSQSNFQKGIIVNHERDTISGFIDYREWTKNPSEILFKKTLTSEAKKLAEKEITYFEVVNNEAYRLALLPISMDKVDLPDLSIGTDSTHIFRAVFLKIIEKGKNVTLLSYRDNLKTRFYIETGKGVEELVFKRYYLDEKKQKTSTENLFRGQLLAVSQKSAVEITPAFREKISKTDYTINSLSAIIRNINGQNPKSKTASSRFFAGALLSQNSTAYKGENVLTNGGAAVNYSPGMTLGFDIFFNPRTQKLMFRNELTLSSSKAAISRDEGYKKTAHSFQQMILAISPQIIQNAYNTNQLKINVGAGLSGTFARTNNNYYRVSYQQQGSGFSDSERKDFIEIKKFWYALPIRTGIVFRNRYEVSAQYTVPISSISNYQTYSINRSSMNLGFNYLFSKK